MKKLTLIALCLSALVTLAQTALPTRPEGEMILDGAFDVLQPYANTKCHWGFKDQTGYKGWIGTSYNAEGSHCEYDNTIFVSKPNSMKLVSADATGAVITQRFSHRLKPNTKYLVSCKVKMQDVVAVGKNGGFCLNLWDDANRWFPTVNMTGTCDWKELSFVHTTSATCDKSNVSYFCVRIMSATGTVWIDDLSLKEITDK